MQCFPRIAWLVMLSALVVPAAGRARSTQCPVVDAYADFAALARYPSAADPGPPLDEFHQTFLRRFADLYTPEAVGRSPGPRMDAGAVKIWAAIQASPELDDTHDTLIAALPSVTAAFTRAFRDFRCDFPIYVAPTFGQLDGAGRAVGGRPSLILGVDVIARVEHGEQLRVFLTHELFHRYHFQAAGFSDDDGDRAVIWRTLWAEGLATYVSARLNPDRPLSDALLLPVDLEARAAPMVSALARDLLVGLDRVDPALYGGYFEYGNPTAERAGRPWRSGYYLGYLVARRLGERRTLYQLAHLKGPALRQAIGQALEQLARG